MADEEQAIIGPAPPEPVNVIIQHRLSGLGLHLDERLLARGRLLQDQVDVGQGLTHPGDPLPAGAGEDKIHQGFEIGPMERADHLRGDGDHRAPRLAGADDDRLVDGINPPEKVIRSLHATDRLAVGRDLGQDRAQLVDAKRLAPDVGLAPPIDRLPYPAAAGIVVGAEPDDLGVGEGPPQMPIGEGDPETIRPERIEVADLADAVLGLAWAPASLHQEPGDGLPIFVEAHLVRDHPIPEMHLPVREPALCPPSAATELDVADVMRSNGLHGFPQSLRMYGDGSGPHSKSR